MSTQIILTVFTFLFWLPQHAHAIAKQNQLSMEEQFLEMISNHRNIPSITFSENLDPLIAIDEIKKSN